MDSGRWQTPSAQEPVHAWLRLPGSKSITNRALVLAALSDSPSVVRGPLKARDSALATAALRAMGCAIDEFPTHLVILPGLPERISAATKDVLDEIGIDVLTGAKVTEVTPEGLRLADGSFVASELVVWAAGVKAPEVLRHLDGGEALVPVRS